jgi:uncharacterized lipoprotein YddW (UPF0748 family)
MAGIWLNEDNSHYFFTRAENAAQPDKIREFIMQYKNTNVERLFLSANSQKTSYPSEAGDVIYKDVDWDNPDRPNFRKWCTAVIRLEEAGIDLYSTWIDLCRKIGVSPWMSMRMNDVHNVDNVGDPMHSSFYKNNLEFRRAMHRDEKWEDRQLNYLIKDVREYHFGILKEYFEKFDFDGIELDWMRFGNHFPVGYEDAGREVLNEFMRKARELADEFGEIRGHKIEIAARVPVKPETAFDMGMDGVGWALAGYVDCLIPSPFWHTSQEDIPVERWKRQVAGTGCKIAPCIELGLRQYAFPKCRNELQMNNIETIRGASVSFMDRGADAIYLFNYMDEQRFAYDNITYNDIISEIGDYEKMASECRRFILTFNDRRPEGTPSDEVLPYKLQKGKFAGFRLHTGNLQENEKRFVLLSFQGKSCLDYNDIRVYINGKEAELSGTYEVNGPKPPDTLFAFKVPEESLKDGYQVVELEALKDGLTADWIEILSN